MASALGYGLTSYLSSITAHNAAFDILYDIRMRVMEKLGKIPAGFFTGNKLGGIRKIFIEDVEQIEIFVAHNISEVVAAVATPLFTLVFLFVMDWRLALVTLIPILISMVMLMLSLTKPEGAENQRQMMQAREDMEGTIIEYIHGMPVIKIFGRTGSSFQRYENAISHFMERVTVTAEFCKNMIGTYYAFFGAQILFLIPAIIWLLGSGERYAEQLPVILLFLLIGSGMKEPLENMMNVTIDSKKISAGVERIDAILNYGEIMSGEAAALPDHFDITFENVDFSYEAGTNTISGASFRLEENTVNALVGPSGGGKSTLAELLLHFYEIAGGSIRIGDVDIREISVNELMNMISYCFQDSFVFTDTVENIIRMGNHAATQEQVMEAAKSANIHDVIMALPNGYQTVLGEDGAYLSGGEIQRLAIARVFLKDTPIMVLDEVTAYADAENESKIQEAFAKLAEHKTVLMIAHRLKSIQNADQILVVNDGKIIAAGKHTELMESCSIYQNMVTANERRDSWTIRAKEVTA